MAERLINVAAKFKNGLIKELDESKFFQLNDPSTKRGDLMAFVASLALTYGDEPTPININGKQDSLTRESYVENFKSMFAALYFDKVISEDVENCIDSIKELDKIFNLFEQYANTGFSTLKEIKEDVHNNEEVFMYKLISEMDRKFDTYAQEINNVLNI